MSEELSLISHLGSATLEIDNNEQHHCKILIKMLLLLRLFIAGIDIPYQTKERIKEFLYFAMWIRKRT